MPLRRRSVAVAVALAALLGGELLQAQVADRGRRTPVTIGLTGSAFGYDRWADPEFAGPNTLTAGAIGATLGWGGTPRWLDIESRVTVSQVREGPRSERMVVTPLGFAPVFGRSPAPWLVHVEHQFALIAPGTGARPFVSALLGNRLLRGSQSAPGIMPSFSYGFGLGTRLEARDARSLGVGYRIRDSFVSPRLTQELTFDVRVPIR